MQVDIEIENKSTPFKHDTSLNIYQRLLLCMQAVKYIQKDGKIENAYKFASHDQITRACSDAFVTYGVYPRVNIIKESLDIITVKKYDKYNKKEYEVTEYVACVKAVYELVNVDNPSEKVTITAYGQGQDNQDKAFGKATSYACKYALLKGLGIETGDDPDKDADSNSKTQPTVNKPIGKPTMNGRDIDEMQRMLEHNFSASINKLAKPIMSGPDIYTIDEMQLTAKGLKDTIEGMLSLINSSDDQDKYHNWKNNNLEEIERFTKNHPEYISSINAAYKAAAERLPIIRSDNI